MTQTKEHKLARTIFIALLFIGSFFFFNFGYRYHLIFTEQLQVFTLTWEHFLSYLSRPGFLSSYTGDFITQFYFLSGGAAIAITASLFVLWLLTGMLMKKISGREAPVLISALPVILSWIALCDPEYPVSNIISLIISVSISLLYLSVNNRMIRIPLSLVLLFLSYILAGSSFYLVAVVMICSELESGNAVKKILVTGLVIIAVAGIPWIMRTVYLLTAGQAYLYLSEMTRTPGIWQYLPNIAIIACVLNVFIFSFKKWEFNYSTFSRLIQEAILVAGLVAGISFVADFKVEKILRLDFEARRQEWNEVISLSEKYNMHNSLAAYYTNMALGKTGRLADELMNFYQPAATGLFIPVNANENYFTIALSNEIYWQLGDVNAAQHSCLLGIVFSPRGQNSRLLKRLVEINIVNGQYAPAEKFIKILEKTMFHRSWARSMRKYLYNEKECSASEWISAKRKIIPARDLLKKGNEYQTTLRMLADNNPDNRLATDYLLSFHLLSKDVQGFLKDFEKYYRSDSTPLLPKVYQEGLLITIMNGERKPEDFKNFRFSPLIVKDMADFTRQFAESQGNGALLQRDFGKTYWFYYHFAKMKTY
jgi:hypothetical protein